MLPRWLSYVVLLALLWRPAGWAAGTDTGGAEWEAPVPAGPTAQPSFIRRAFSSVLEGDFLPGGGYRRELKRYENIEDQATNPNDKAAAVLGQAKVLADAGKYWKAFERYQTALDKYANFLPFNDVLRQLFDLAESKFTGKYDRALLVIPVSSNKKAMNVYDFIVKVGPYSAQAPLALHRSALLAEQRGEYEDAVTKLTKLVNEYPLAPQAADARVDLAKAILDMATNKEADLTLLRRAGDELEYFLKQYPRHDRRAEAEGLLKYTRQVEASRLLFLGKFYQRPVHRRDDASRRYLGEIVSQYGDTSCAAEAEERLATIENRAPRALPAPAPATGGGGERYLRPLDDVKPSKKEQ